MRMCRLYAQNGPFAPKENFFRKPLNKPCYFHSRLSTYKKPVPDVTPLMSCWQLKNIEIWLTESIFVNKIFPRMQFLNNVKGSITYTISRQNWMMMNCFCGMVDRRKAFSLISSRDHCQRSSPSRISLWHAGSRVWTCAEPEFRLCRMKMNEWWFCRINGSFALIAFSLSWLTCSSVWPKTRSESMATYIILVIEGTD